MFYPVESLRRGGRFYLCWIADAWPWRFATIPRRQISDEDICETCDALLEVINNESGSSKNRFSLRLSCRLLRGLVLLYQRQVNIFIGDLCMINAYVMKQSHKKFGHDKTKQPIHSELPRLIFEEPPDDEEVEEKIQNSHTTLANIEDITLREPTLPEIRMLLDDGFGELHPDQPLQLLDSTVEMMLAQDTSVQHSRLDLPVDMSDRSQDRSRLIPHEAQMERISEHDISMLRKSVGAEIVPGSGKDILEIPEIPPPIAPEPHNVNMERNIPDIEIIQETPKENELDELILQDLEPQTKRRKLRHKLIVDRKTVISSNYMRSRLEHGRVELRCESCEEDVASLLVPSQQLLGESARRLARPLAALFAHAANAHRAPPQVEQPLAAKMRTYQSRSVLERIDEELEPVEKWVDNAIQMSRHADISNITPPDISEIPTQKILTELSQVRKRTSEIEISPKRLRKNDFTSYRFHQFPVDVSHYVITSDANKENIPVDNLEAGRSSDLIQVEELQRSYQRDSGGSETPLGSLDRTKVSLGDSDRTTDSRKFIREEWGTEGTMHKIYRAVMEGSRHVTVDSLLQAGPLLLGHTRIVAARCFTSILKLKQHGFIIVHKDSVTQEIVNIELGEKITKKR